ncbi:MAG: hypothetical protein L3J52_03025 [Proteobacteria bacterium]|nr:hypothetical protein [Pseudomonadota bacterium]
MTLELEQISRVKQLTMPCNLPKKMLSENAVPQNSVEDALHISIASVQKMDFLLTWNFKHINNANTRNKIIDVVKHNGFQCPVLCSPEELINER